MIEREPAYVLLPVTGKLKNKAPQSVTEHSREKKSTVKGHVMPEEGSSHQEYKSPTCLQQLGGNALLPVPLMIRQIECKASPIRSSSTSAF